MVVDVVACYNHSTDACAPPPHQYLNDAHVRFHRACKHQVVEALVASPSHRLLHSGSSSSSVEETVLQMTLRMVSWDMQAAKQ